MNISGYEIDLEKAVKSINKNKYKRVLLQIPEGLKPHTLKFVDYIEGKTNTRVIISADPCFGACDIPTSNIENFGIEFIVSIGHTSIPNINNSKIQTLFLNAKSNLDVTKIIEKAIPHIKGKKVGLVSTSQHAHILNKAKKILIENKFEPLIGKGDNRIELKGQILGCNFSAAKSIADKVDSFLFFGSGNFHPLGLIFITNKQVIVCDPYTCEVKDKELYYLKDMILRQRYGAIARSKDTEVFGIVVGSKIGQQRLNLAYEIKEKLDLKGKKSYIFSLDNFSPDFLEGFKEIDCYVSTACPRIAIDDYMKYKVPIITPIELEILLNIKRWEDYHFDEIF